MGLKVEKNCAFIQRRRRKVTFFTLNLFFFFFLLLLNFHQLGFSFSVPRPTPIRDPRLAVATRVASSVNLTVTREIQIYHENAKTK